MLEDSTAAIYALMASYLHAAELQQKIRVSRRFVVASWSFLRRFSEEAVQVAEVLFGFISVKTELRSRIKSLKLWNKEEREGLFEQEERLNRKKKHKKEQSTKAKNFAEKYSLDESEIFLSP